MNNLVNDFNEMAESYRRWMLSEIYGMLQSLMNSEPRDYFAGKASGAG
jgi:hypothetical protein